MGKKANTAGPQLRDDTKRKSATAGLLAAFWPSLLGPEHGKTWRAQNRVIWRRRLTHVALVAAITSISAVAASPPFHQTGDADVPQTRAGGGGAAEADRGLGEAAGGGRGHSSDGARRVSLHLRDGPDDGASDTKIPSELQTPSPMESVDDHLNDAVEGGAHASWGTSAPYSSTLVHYVPGFSGGGGGGGYGSGEGSNGGNGGGGLSSSGDAPSADSGDPGEQTGPGAPDAPHPPGQPTRPPYIVDPDDGPHQPGDPQWPPEDWRPRTRPPQPLSAVPEPQTWLMMIVGFALIGGALRGRRERPDQMYTRPVVD